VEAYNVQKKKKYQSVFLFLFFAFFFVVHCCSNKQLFKQTTVQTTTVQTTTVQILFHPILCILTFTLELSFGTLLWDENSVVHSGSSGERRADEIEESVAHGAVEDTQVQWGTW
jgi:hypothetical protein